MKRFGVVLAGVCLLTSCYAKQEVVRTYSSSCIPESVHAAMVWKDKAPVRIAVQRIKEDLDHAYAEVKVGDEWLPLTQHWKFNERRIAVSVGVKSFNVRPYRYLTLKEWLEEQTK